MGRRAGTLCMGMWALTLACPAPGGVGGSGSSTTSSSSSGSLAPDAGEDLTQWPNSQSSANSDAWLVQHHDTLRVMRPRLLAINFVNGRTMGEMRRSLEDITSAIAEATRFHGDVDPNATAFLQYELAYAVDMTDATFPPEDFHQNSSRYPREAPQQGYWGFDYAALFGEDFAVAMDIRDPSSPDRPLRLCEAVDRGLVHEVWLYGDADHPDVSAAEILGIKPFYDDAFQRLEARGMDRCAGNGCFDRAQDIPSECTRTLRIGWVNHTRGVGCFMESLGHGFEWIGNGNTIPYLHRYFPEFAGFDLDVRHGVGFRSWYDHCGGGDCLVFPTQTSVQSVLNPAVHIDPYVPVCGNAHFPPNGRAHYDVVNPMPVATTCRGWRAGGGANGSDVQTLEGAATWAGYEAIAPDCTGSFAVWWWQQFPGVGTQARDDSGAIMKNWWPFLFY